jgi:hypothetical protein
MADIGRTSIGANPIARANQSRCQYGAGSEYTAIVGDVVTLFSVYGHNNGGAGHWHCALFDVAAALPVNRVHAPVDLTPTAAVAQWWTVAVNIALVAGTKYQFAVGLHGSPMIYEDNTPAPITTQCLDNTPPDPWAHFANSSAVMSAFATVGVAPPPASTIIYPCRAHNLRGPPCHHSQTFQTSL